MLTARAAITRSAPHVFVVEAPPDAPVVVTVAGRSIDVKARIAATPDSSASGHADAPNRRMGIETLLIEAPHPSSIELRVEHNDHPAARGHVDIRAVALPVATHDDQDRLEAARQDAAGCLANGRVELGGPSADAFAAAARLHGRIGDGRRQGLSLLHAAGARYTRLSDWGGAAGLAASARRLLEDARSAEHAAYALRLEGAALDQRGNAEHVSAAQRDRDIGRARALLTQAAERFSALGNHYEAGYAINYRGVSFDVAGERDEARSDFLEALGHFRSAGDAPAQALSLQSLALQSHQDGRLTEATREFDAALALIPREEAPEDYAHTLHNSAWPLRAVGRFGEAIERFHQAARILHERGDRNGEARALHGLGTTLIYAGEPDRAAELLETAIALRGESGARREQAISMMALGQLELESREAEHARQRLQGALELLSAPHDVAQARLLLARAHLASNSMTGARRELDAILELGLPPTHRTLGLALAELGELESRAGHAERSIGLFDRALQVLDDSGSELEHARTQVLRSEARLRAGDASRAVADSTAALERLDAIGLNALHAESRAMFRAANRDATEAHIAARLAEGDLMRRRGQAERAQAAVRAALAASDRQRAAWLAETGTARAAGAPAGLVEKRAGLYEQLAGKRQLRERLLGSARPDEKRLALLTRDIALLRTEAAMVEGRIAGQGDLRRPASTAPDALPSLSKGVVVAEYFIGRDRSWLFALRDGSVEAHALGRGEDIAREAHALHLQWRSAPRATAAGTSAARSLASTLFAPIGRLRPGETLVVIPDGPLHVVPMAVLAEASGAGIPAGSVHVSTNLGALSSHATSGKRAPKRQLAIIADPIYSADDVRLAGGATDPSADSTWLTRSAARFAAMRRLPASAAESKAIKALSKDAMTLSGADATRERVSAAGLGDFRILHFATHAVADGEDPALATLAFSRFDLEGKPISGNLASFEIAQLELNADLVVLSACETALGREVAGEGPLGLAHAFMRAGARNVLATLWQVPDTSTALLMQAFYRELLVEGRPAQAALALAQAKLRSQPRWSDPYYWAGFQLISNAPLNDVRNKVH